MSVFKGPGPLAKLFLGLTLGATWEPTRSLVFGCDLGHEQRRTRGDLTLPYGARRVGCSAQFLLR